jgi:hypothetical protein
MAKQQNGRVFDAGVRWDFRFWFSLLVTRQKRNRRVGGEAGMCWVTPQSPGNAHDTDSLANFRDAACVYRTTWQIDAL